MKPTAAWVASATCRGRGAILFLFPIYWLVTMSFKTPRRSSPTRRSGGRPRSSSATSPCCSRTATPGRSGTAWSSPPSARRRPWARHALRLLDRALPHRRRQLRHVGLSNRMVPPIVIVFPVFLLYVKLGWVDTFIGLIVLYTAFNLPYVIWMMRGYIQDIPLELEDRRWSTAAPAGACSGRWCCRWRAPASSPPPCSPSSSPGTSSCSRWCSPAATSPPSRCR